jgi:hypothetical protein
MIGSTQTTRVFPSPSKTPYGGFSPVRLQTEIRPQPSSRRPSLSAARIHSAPGLICDHSPGTQVAWPIKGLTVAGSQRADPSGTRPSSTGQFRPEALGSPAGYAVPPDHRLLWPHPSLWLPSTHLWFREWLLQPMGLHRAESQRVPNLLPASVPSCRPPYPGGPDGCLWLYFTIRAGLHHLCKGSASTNPRMAGSGVGCVTRLQGSLPNTGLRRPDFHRQETGHYGLQAEAQSTRRKGQVSDLPQGA